MSEQIRRMRIRVREKADAYWHKVVLEIECIHGDGAAITMPIEGCGQLRFPKGTYDVL